MARMSRRLLRPIVSVKRAAVLAYDEGANVATFRWRGDPVAPPATVTLSNGTTTVGPFTVGGSTSVNIGELADGIWTVTSQANNSKNVLDRVVGQIRVITTFDWSHATEMNEDFTTTTFDWSLVNG